MAGRSMVAAWTRVFALFHCHSPLNFPPVEEMQKSQTSAPDESLTYLSLHPSKSVHVHVSQCTHDIVHVHVHVHEYANSNQCNCMHVYVHVLAFSIHMCITMYMYIVFSGQYTYMYLCLNDVGLSSYRSLSVQTLPPLPRPLTTTRGWGWPLPPSPCSGQCGVCGRVTPQLLATLLPLLPPSPALTHWLPAPWTHYSYTRYCMCT